MLEGSVFEELPVRVGLSTKVFVVVRAVAGAGGIELASDRRDVLDGPVPGFLDAYDVVVIAVFL